MSDLSTASTLTKEESNFGCGSAFSRGTGRSLTLEKLVSGVKDTRLEATTDI